ncbi:MAG: FHA domain-containing protein, partial [Anaerolineae bacterium]
TGKLVVQATGAVLPLQPGKLELLIGREDPIGGIYPDVDLTNHGGDEGGVSRKHARLTVQGGQYAIEDLNSVNGTFVNGVRLAFGEQCLLSDSDQIRAGRVLLVLQVS